MPAFTMTFGARSSTKNVTAPQAARVLSALRAHWGQVLDAGTAQMRDRTDAEVVDKLFDVTLQNIIDITRRAEGDAAAAAARAAVADISPT